MIRDLIVNGTLVRCEIVLKALLIIKSILANEEKTRFYNDRK